MCFFCEICHLRGILIAQGSDQERKKAVKISLGPNFTTRTSNYVIKKDIARLIKTLYGRPKISLNLQEIIIHYMYYKLYIDV